MIDWTAVKNDLYDWADAQLTDPIIWADENAPPPDGAYVTLRIATTVQVGQDAIKPPNGSGIATIVGNREFTLEIQAFSGSALTNVDTLRTSLEKPSVLALLRAEGIVFVDTLGSNNISGLIDGSTEIEKRHALDILFRLASITTDDVGYIEKVELEGTYKDVSGAVKHIETFDVET